MTIAFAHNLTVFLVAIWGYTALLLTGEFSTPVLVAAYVMAGAAYAFRLRNLSLPTWFWNGISILALFLTLGMATRQLLDATVYLFTFLQIVKLFTARSPNEMRWCYVISLFHVIGASVLTTSMSFGMVFLGYVILMIFSLLLYTLRRESELTERYASNLLEKRRSTANSRSTLPYLHTPWALTTKTPRGLVWTSVILTVLVVIGTFITFMMVPRLATQNLFQGYGTPPEKPSVSAFDESIEFGTFEKIQLDSAVAMYVQPLQDTPPDHVRLRGVALDTFDGRAWRRTTPADYSSGNHAFSSFTTKVHPRQHRYRMIQPPGITNYLFADTFPEQLIVPREISYYLDSFSGAAWMPTMYPKEFQYTAESRVERLEDRKDPAGQPAERPSYLLNPRRDMGGGLRGDHRPSGDWVRNIQERLSASLATTTNSATQTTATQGSRNARRTTMLQRYLNTCTSVPEALNSARVRELARDWTADATTSFEMAMAIERRFRTDFGYTLEPKSRGNFIEDFLFRTREGHCEYFATSMAVLARTLGLPARVVNGYYCVEWNNIGGNFTVRQRDAHSWVEVWLNDDYGWMTFDPTPPSGVGRPVNRNAAILAFLRLNDALRVRWYRYVVDFSMNDQAAIMRTLLSARERLNRLLSGFQQLSPFKQTPQEEVVSSKGTYFSIAVAVGVAGLLAAAAVALVRRIARRKRRRADTVVRYYSELLRLLARKGFRMNEGQTPREFADAVAVSPELQPIVPITEYYYGSRYEGRDLTEEEARTVAEFRRILLQKQNPAR